MLLKEIKEITDLGYNDINIKNIEANLENNFLMNLTLKL